MAVSLTAAFLFEAVEVAEERLEVRFHAKAGQHLVAVTFMGKDTVPEGVYQPPLTQFQLVQFKGGNPYIDNIVITGPYDPTGVAETPSRHKIFVCRPARSAQEDACAEKILSTLARLAYRRPATDKDLRILLRVYQAGRSEGGFESGIQAALERILAGPEFLFRIERDPAGVGGPAVANQQRRRAERKRDSAQPQEKAVYRNGLAGPDAKAVGSPARQQRPRHRRPQSWKVLLLASTPVPCSSCRVARR